MTDSGDGANSNPNPSSNPNPDRGGRADRAVPSPGDGRADASATALPSGWVPLVRYGWGTAFAVARPLVFLPLVIPLWQLIPIGYRDPPLALSVAGLAVTGVMAIAGMMAFYRWRPVPHANFDTNELRVGRLTAPMSELGWARLSVFEQKKSRSVTLEFGFGSGPGPNLGSSRSVGGSTGAPTTPSGRSRRGRVVYLVRGMKQQTQPADTAKLVAEVLRRSTITMPRSPDDPHGRFAQFNFPGHITRDEAIAVVLNPPAFADPLPIPPSHMFDPPRPLSRGSKPARKARSAKPDEA